MILYTAQNNYYGDDRLDITVKGNHPIGSLFAPTWDMVKQHKSKSINDLEYTYLYWKLIGSRLKEKKGIDTLETILSQTMVTLVCFCKPNKFCHRHIAAHILNDMILPRGYYVEYKGERK